MPWKEVGKVELRMAFVSACGAARASFSALCSEFGISRKTGYKWYGRYLEEGLKGLEERSRRPRRIHRRIDERVVEALLAERKAHPAWGARKLRRVIKRKGLVVPSERTVNRILSRAGLVDKRVARVQGVTRFERPAPNDLWQVDHKRAIHGRWSRRCVPFVVLDDHSRYLVGLKALSDKGLDSTWAATWEILGEFGLPRSVLSDNDAVFRGGNGPSQFEARLMRLGIQVLHGKPYHPQTQGKVERFNGTLQRELLRDSDFSSAQEVQRGFDLYRWEYNFYRPHEALGLEVPGSAYRPSGRLRPGSLPEMEYAGGTPVRRVDKDGWVHWKGRLINAGRGLYREWVEVREAQDSVEIYFGPYRITQQRLTEARRDARKKGRGGGILASGCALSSDSTAPKV
ncbi:MAG: IS481 family transposase [Planctomycetota bacterium]|jgi:transposase InsO family protein